MAFERIDSEVLHEGRIVSVSKDLFRYDDGGDGEREIVHLQGAVGVVAHDGERLYLVKQPREAVNEPALLELPAGKLDPDDEDALSTAKRELAEEIGKGARHWEHIKTFYTSPGFADEDVHLFLATDLYDEHADSGEDERIEIVAVPLAELDDVIAENRDSKTLIGLLWFKAYLAGR